MITYRTVLGGVKVPVLHKVYHSAPQWDNVYHWCEKNCKHRFYTSPTWVQIREKKMFVQFECDEDAALASVWFPLMWG